MHDETARILSNQGGCHLKVRIVTDSTASIPAEICRDLEISVVPCTVHFGTETFVDSVDPTEVFYSQLSAAKVSPTTSTPSPGAFEAAFRGAAASGAAVIAIHLMETKSALINVGRMVAKQLDDLEIHIVDARTTSLGLGLITMAAARAAKAGQSAAEVLQLVDDLIHRADVHVVIAEMTQLRKSGRVSLGQALVADFLKIKPVLYVGQSMIEVVDKVRSWPKAIDRMIDLAKEKAGDARVTLAVIHTNNEAEARALLERIRPQFKVVEELVAEAGSALATHAGPGALGIITVRHS